MNDILLIEDDENLGLSLEKYLKGERYSVKLCPTIKDAKEQNLKDFKIVILDWMLPDGQGLDYLKEIRQKGNHLPVLMLTARTELIDKVIGLESGANDYLTKPFEPRELIARIRVQLREKNNFSSELKDIINIGDISVNKGKREVTYLGKKLELTKLEYELLVLLAETPGKPFTREELLNKIWGYETYPSTRTVDTHILQLRQKTSDEYFETIRGIGYRFKEF
ncbi:MAG: DNA-binding response regulator [Epsilonproteobacteria bacterium]|nr:MAG: DNA-binding response regulator [Campylobacterota bacterium]RLA68097.1 MAG: DNA-binding response regulator [Campylobacterota bacterium]